MVLETILEVVIPFIGRIIGFIFLEIFFHLVIYTIGYVVLKIITYGKYPEEEFSLESDLHRETYVYLMGLIGLAVIIVIILI